MQNTMWVGNKQFEHNMGKCNKRNRPALHNDRTCPTRNTERAMQVRHAKLQARFSGNDESGKGLQQLEHVYVLVAMHEVLKQRNLFFSEQIMQCQVRSWC